MKRFLSAAATPPRMNSGLLLALLLALPVAARAATLWTGPMLTFTDPAGADPTQAVNQDRLTPGVWITRANTEGIYNAAVESSFTHFYSPADTQWADGTLANYSTLSYTDWDTWAKNIHGGPPNTVGVPAVMHLVNENIYLSVEFLNWGGSSGGFQYERSTLAVPEPSAELLLLAGLALAGLRSARGRQA